jgi:uncharacterized protein (DUF1015 family)
MSVIRPFRGLRVRPQYVQQVAAPPYDVLGSEEARERVRENPISFLRVNKPEVDFDPDTPIYSEQVYRRGKDNLDRLVQSGIMCRDEKPCFYLYRLTMGSHRQTGLMALTSVEEYKSGLIKKHEHTRLEKVNDRADHIMTVQAQVGPVFSVFRHRPEVKTIFDNIAQDPPTYDFASDGQVRHQMWVIGDTEVINTLVAAFAEFEHLYIADGHHRAASAAEVARRLKDKNRHHPNQEHYNFFLNVLFPDNELRILPYNRVVKDLNGMSLEQLLDKAGQKFRVAPNEHPVVPEKPYHFGLYCNRRWFELAVNEGSFAADQPAKSIDAAILSDNFLTPILGIKDIRTDKRIDFVGGIRGVNELVRLVDSGQFAIAFSLYPVTVEQLLRVADAGEVMPPKSTWFEPKLRSGLVINLLDE